MSRRRRIGRRASAVTVDDRAFVAFMAHASRASRELLDAHGLTDCVCHVRHSDASRLIAICQTLLLEAST